MTVRQQNRPAYHAEIGLVPGGHGCQQAPKVGIRCSVSVRLASGNVQYSLEILDGHGRVRYTRTASLPQYYLSGGLTFLIYDRWQRVSVDFDAPTMGTPATIPLVVTASYEDDKRQIDGILVGPQTLQKSMTLVDSDKSGATHLLGSTTLHSPADAAALYYDGKSFVNPTISVAGYLRASRHLLVPFLRVHEYTVPSHTQTSTNAGFGRLLLNSDGSITFLENGAVGRIDSSGTIRETNLGLYEFDIANGADGHVWALVSGTSGPALARLNGDGTLTQITLPDWSYGPLATGADGNFWMAASGSVYNSIVRRVTPTGTITDFPLPAPGGSLIGSVAGGDGNIWFVGSGQQFAGAVSSGMFAKVQPDGTIARYWLPGIDQPCCAAAVEDPVWAPNGKLYTAIGYANLGQVTEDGIYHQFRTKMQMQTPAASPPIMTTMGVGPDGAMWYPAQPIYGLQCVLGRATTSGQVAFVRFASDCSGSYIPEELPNAFVAGPNNTLWYTRGDVVGEISL